MSIVYVKTGKNLGKNFGGNNFRDFEGLIMKKRFQYTCAHCMTGMVADLPARCPECHRLLSVPVESKTKRMSKKT